MADHPSEPMRSDVAAGAAVAQAPVALGLPETRVRGRLGELFEREHVLAGALLAPTLLILILFIAYPFGLGLWLAVTDKVVRAFGIGDTRPGAAAARPHSLNGGS